MKRPLLLCACALAAGCARVDEDVLADGGISAALRIVEVAPLPGAVAPGAQFRVSFSAPMDRASLLTGEGRSETVVLAAGQDAETVAAGLARGKLSASLRSRLLPARAVLDEEARTLDLSPVAPLRPGELWLLVSPRLKDATGRRLAGEAPRFPYSVGDNPRLRFPRSGSVAPANLARVRVIVGDSGRGAMLSIAGPSGMVAAAVAASDGGVTSLDLCPLGAECAVLRPGSAYALAVNGAAVAGERFTAGDCRQTTPPAIRSARLDPGAGGILATVELAAPALVRLEAALAPDKGGDDDAALAAACATSACAAVEEATSCEPQGCAAADAGDAGCRATVRLGGLPSPRALLARVVATDDEGHRASSPTYRIVTALPLPKLRVSRVMADPPPPAPRVEGQFVEIENRDPVPVDLAPLALRASDRIVRPLASSSSGGGIGPGERVLAVGAGFDAGRYPSLAAGTQVLRAATQRLLGRGVGEASPKAFDLVVVQPDGGPVSLDSFPGGISCPAGAGIERSGEDPQSPASWSCGTR